MRGALGNGGPYRDAELAELTEAVVAQGVSRARALWSTVMRQEGRGAAGAAGAIGEDAEAERRLGWRWLGERRAVGAPRH